MEATEKKVIEKALEGDRNAVKLLYDRYSDFLTAICSRFFPARVDQCDILQDSFVKIFSSLDRFVYKGEGSLKAWMKQITINECLKALRNRKRSVPIVYEGELRDTEEEDDSGPPDLTDVPAGVIHRMIQELPEGYRAVFNLFALERKPHKEIALLLGISESTSASQFARAKGLLAKKIIEYSSNNKVNKKR